MARMNFHFSQMWLHVPTFGKIGIPPKASAAKLKLNAFEKGVEVVWLVVYAVVEG